MKRTDIEEKLGHLRDREVSGDALIEEVKMLIAEDDHRETQIHKEITEGIQMIEEAANAFDMDLLAAEKIYHIDQIKRICVVYRLRFLESRYFKEELPYEALCKIKHLQSAHGITISGFKIMAPARCFKLKNADDPLLFAPLGNGYYYLIHKWGRDLSPWRKIRMWPMRNFECMIGSLFALSLLLAFLAPKGLFSENIGNVEFFIIALLMFKLVGAMTIYYMFRKGENFSPAVWRSTYFNA